MDATQQTVDIAFDSTPIQSVTQQKRAEEAIPILPLAVVTAPVETAPALGDSAVQGTKHTGSTYESLKTVEKEAETLHRICFHALQAMLIATDCAYSKYSSPFVSNRPTDCSVVQIPIYFPSVGNGQLRQRK